jgi:hypothetical protein
MRIRRTIYLNKDKEWRVKISTTGKVFPEWLGSHEGNWVRPYSLAQGMNVFLIRRLVKLKKGQSLWVTDNTCVTRTHESKDRYGYKCGCQWISVAVVRSIYKNANASSNKFFRRHEGK